MQELASLNPIGFELDPVGSFQAASAESRYTQINAIVSDKHFGMNINYSSGVRIAFIEDRTRGHLRPVSS
jgi:hypothetical protein